MHNGFHVGQNFECFYGFVCVCVGGGLGLSLFRVLGLMELCLSYSGPITHTGQRSSVGLQWNPSGSIDLVRRLPRPTYFVPHRACIHPLNRIDVGLVYMYMYRDPKCACQRSYLRVHVPSVPSSGWADNLRATLFTLSN